MNVRNQQPHIVTLLLVGAAAVAATAGCAAQPTPPPIQASQDPLACNALAEAAQSPIDASADDLEITPLYQEDLPWMPGDEDPVTAGPVGVELSLAARPGWTTPWLKRRAACYRASRPSSQDDPLLVVGAQVSVTESGGRFHLRIVSERPEVGEAIVAAARSFSAGPHTAVALR